MLLGCLTEYNDVIKISYGEGKILEYTSQLVLESMLVFGASPNRTFTYSNFLKGELNAVLGIEGLSKGM